MNFYGRNIDVLGLWQDYVDLPNDLTEPLPTFLPKLRCPNPDHDTHKRHFQINTLKPFVHCFAECGISGTYEHALMVITGCTMKEAKRLILQHGRIGLKGVVPIVHRGGTRKVLDSESEVASDESKIRRGTYVYIPSHVRRYLDSRGIGASDRGKWQLGYDEVAERLVIPAFDQSGSFRFLIRREINYSSSLKYLYTPGSIKTAILFGQNLIDRQKVCAEGLILVEGPIDAIYLHSVGFPNAVAILGTGISKQQIRLVHALNPPCVYALFDKDSAGVYNALTAWQGREGKHRGLSKVPLRICRYPTHATDPADLNAKEVAKALERAVTPLKFQQLLRNANVRRLVKNG